MFTLNYVIRPLATNLFAGAASLDPKAQMPEIRPCAFCGRIENPYCPQHETIFPEPEVYPPTGTEEHRDA